MVTNEQFILSQILNCVIDLSKKKGESQKLQGSTTECFQQILAGNQKGVCS